MGAEPDGEAKEGGHEEHPGREHDFGDRSAGDDGRAGDGQRAEAVVHTGCGVFGHAGRRVHPGPQERGGQEAGDEEVDVVHGAAGVDGAAEDVAEDEQEQGTHDRRKDDELRRAEELQARASGRLARRGQEARA